MNAKRIKIPPTSITPMTPAAHPWKRSFLRTLTILTFLIIPGAIAQSSQQWTTNQLPAGCIAWWQAENNLLDSIGAHNGVPENGPNYYPPSYATGRHGQAWSLNGANQSVRIPNAYADLDGWTQFTMEAWVNIANLIATPGNGYSVFSKVGNNRGPYSGNYGYQFGFTLNAAELFCQFNVDGQLWPGFQTLADLHGAVATNAWVHVAATYNSAAVKLYLNGVPLVTNTIGSATIASTFATLRISMDDNYNVPFPGLIDDARLYNRALSEDEIAYLYSGPPPILAIRTAGPGTNIVSWPAPANAWVLLQSPALGAAATWSHVPPPYQTNATEAWAALTNTPSSMFYRLRWAGTAP
jgi:hypothetical protein